MRLLLDTCVIIDMLVDKDSMDEAALRYLEDYNNIRFASMESMRELVVHFNNKNLLSKRWKTSYEVIDYVENVLNILFLPISRDVILKYSTLQLNTSQNHRDPSDHIIISHAIVEHLTLMTSDEKFSFYCDQGLDLIEY